MQLKKKIYWLVFAIAALCCGTSFAQPATVTITNYVTVVVTNVVTITNFVAAVPPGSNNVAPALSQPAAAGAATAAALAAGTPAAPKIAPTNLWQSAVSAGLTLVRGNSDTMLFSADFSTQHKTPFEEYKIVLNTSYGDQGGKQTVNNYKGSVQWNHLFTDRFYCYLRSDALRDIIAEVDYRATIGPGMGYYLLKYTNTTLATEMGVAYEAQRLDGKDDQDFAALRLAERFERKLNEHARLWESAEILPQVDRFDNYTINCEIGVETALSKSFTLKTFLDDNYDNRPAPGKLKNDAKIVAAIGYKF
jgi:putative salt-induced outer membrane protein YdiY